MPTNPNTCTVDGCPGGNRTRRGMCPKHYQRVQKDLPPLKTRLDQLTELITNPTDQCINWPYGGDGNGYGVVNVNGRCTGAHVQSCTIAHGPKPLNHEAAHACNNRGCVNPRHLRWATPKQNQADRIIHGTAHQGERNGYAKLRTQDVQEIRRLLAAGYTQTSLALKYGVQQPTIGGIALGRTWAWLDVDTTQTINNTQQTLTTHEQH